MESGPNGKPTFTIQKFRGYQQQDAQEFIRYLLDQINTELTLSKRLKKNNLFSTFQGILTNQVYLYIN